MSTTFKRLFGTVLSLALMFAFAIPASAAPGNEGKSKSSLYIVQMLESPVVAYTGDVPGFKATKPAKGQKINPNNPDVVKYASYLDGQHNAALNAVGGAKKIYDYRYSFNGFAAELTAAQVQKLSAVPGVVSVSPNEIRQLDTASTPTFLGLTEKGGLWDQLGGTAGAGEGVVVGVVDSGIWPENPSFSDRDANGKLVFQQIPGWNGKCTPGEQFPASKCNQKLIGAQYFTEGYGGAAGIKAAFPYEFVSARDADGHGSHTASTAAGNYGVKAVVDGTDLGTLSGMAPRARVAAYKVCWGNGGQGGCPTVDNVAAIDQAVADGVDVINYSISGSRTSFLDPVEVAFLFAADAGIFVATSAGNSGPTASTVAHNSPWVMTVAASTHDRVYEATATLGNGASYIGAGLGAAVASSPLVYAGDVGAAGADAAQVKLCYPGSLDTAKVTGKIVVCDRGVIARTDKSLAVKQAGGVGMILINPTPSSINADLHYVPTVHLDSSAYTPVVTYAKTAGATASLGAGTLKAGAAAPIMAAFSSRGPNLASIDLLKPDITAPGVDVLAAVSPIGYNGRNYDFLSGTSMSSPHLAGIAALMKDKYPTWSAAAIKSALMTTASQTSNNGSAIDGGPQAYGAGHVVPNSAANPGLVYDANFNDWLAFLCGTGQLQASYCPSIAIDPSDLNYPSITIGDLAGVQKITRTVTNVGEAGTYTVSVQAPAGVSATVEPSTLTLAKGGKATYTVTFTTQNGAAFNQYGYGSLTWSNGKQSVRSPLAIRPVRLAAPASVSGNGSPIAYDVKFGYNGPFTAQAQGLVAATRNEGTVVDDPTNTFVKDGPGTVKYDISVPAGTAYARFSLFDEFTDGDDDLDLYVYLGNTLVGGSGSGTSAEEVNLTNVPAAGATYTVYVHGWQTDGADAKFTLFNWAVPSTASGNMAVTAPAQAEIGKSGSVSLSFTGLTAGEKYLGRVVYGNGTTSIGNTIVSVNP
jgi:hypothetical protein